MIRINKYIRRFDEVFGDLNPDDPWNHTGNISAIVVGKIKTLGPAYAIEGDIAIHNTASVDSHAILKGPVIISARCFVGAHSLLRGGVFLDENVVVGPGCEIKSSFIFSHSAVAPFNFVGDSFLGSFVNLEAGAVIANHYNERKDRNISVTADGKRYSTQAGKFGALVGDHTKIGANAVLSPGTILPPNTVVGRLQLIDQNP